MGNARWFRNSFVYLLIIVAVVAIFFTIIPNLGGKKEPSLTDVIAWAKEGKITSITVKGDELIVRRIDGEEVSTRKESGTSLFDIFKASGVDPAEKGITITVKGSSGLGSFFGVLINFLPLIFFGALLLFMMRQAQGTNSQTLAFGRSRARLTMVNRTTVTFADVAGCDEAKTELQEIVEFLKYPERFMALGARIPKGVLLMGPPGTGKTLLAKAVAGEAGVPFFSISGSEFVEMFVGVGAARVRDLFDQAKRNAPCIVFVDEIDAVGRHRGAGLGGGHDEREQTLNQILVEMDGFDTSTNVIVVAATNRPDILDPALLRPGRFDRRVVLDLPDINGRKQILEVHTKGKPLAPDVDLTILAKLTPGFSGADISNLVNEAAILAARRTKKVITTAEFQEAIERVIAGPERKSRVISPREKEITAYHEAGHALVAWMLPNADPVHKVSIVARGSMGGYTRLLPEKDRYLWTKSQFEDMLAVSMGGRVAEEIIFGDITTGASNDLENATRIALSMVKRYAMMDRPNYQNIPISNVISEALSGNVDTIEVYGDDLLVRMKDGRLYRSRKEKDFSVVEFFQRQSANGASNDVRVVVKEAGSLGALGPRVFGKREELIFLGKEIMEERDYGDKIAEDIDKEVAAIMQRAYERAKGILTTNTAKLVQIARHLIQHETVEGEELRQLFNSPVPEDIVEQAKHLVPGTPPEAREATPSVSTMPTTQQPAPAEGSNNN